MSSVRPSHATVVAYLALFVALSGTAVALKQGSVGPRAIRGDAVRTSKIKDGAVTTPKLGLGAVTPDRIASGAVGPAQLADDGVIGTKIADDAIDSNQIVAGAVGSAKLKANSVTAGKIEDGAVTGAAVLDGSLALPDIATVVTPISFNAPALPAAGNCANSGDISVPGMQDGDSVLVVPSKAGMGWPIDMALAEYGPTGPGTVVVRVCNRGINPIGASAVPMTALVFR